MENISKNKHREAGFSLVEALIAIVILLIVLLGVFSVFTYSVVFNTGNNMRSQALSVLQREVELTRSAKFTPAITDDSLIGGAKAPKTIAAADGSNFVVSVMVDDDPYTSGIQVDATKTMKEITISVVPMQAATGWQSAVASQVVMRRVRGN